MKLSDDKASHSPMVVGEKGLFEAHFVRAVILDGASSLSQSQSVKITLLWFVPGEEDVDCFLTTKDAAASGR